MKQKIFTVLLSMTMLFGSIPNVSAENMEYTLTDEICVL